MVPLLQERGFSSCPFRGGSAARAPLAPTIRTAESPSGCPGLESPAAVDCEWLLFRRGIGSRRAPWRVRVVSYASSCRNLTFCGVRNSAGARRRRLHLSPRPFRRQWMMDVGVSFDDRLPGWQLIMN